MSIRIYNEGLAGAAASDTSRVQELSRPSVGGKPSSSNASGEDQVQISSLSEGVGAQTAQHAARVQNLKALYESGRYQANSSDVSRALVNHALQAGAE